MMGRAEKNLKLMKRMAEKIRPALEQAARTREMVLAIEAAGTAGQLIYALSLDLDADPKACEEILDFAPPSRGGRCAENEALWQHLCEQIYADELSRADVLRHRATLAKKLKEREANAFATR